MFTRTNGLMSLLLRYIIFLLSLGSSNPGDRVTLVHSLVLGDTAERDGWIQKGDKLICVNGASLVNYTLDFTVEQLSDNSPD